MSIHTDHLHIARRIRGGGGWWWDFEIRDWGRRDFIIAVALIRLSFFYLEGWCLTFWIRACGTVENPALQPARSNSHLGIAATRFWAEHLFNVRPEHCSAMVTELTGFHCILSSTYWDDQQSQHTVARKLYTVHPLENKVYFNAWSNVAPKKTVTGNDLMRNLKNARNR